MREIGNGIRLKFDIGKRVFSFKSYRRYDVGDGEVLGINSNLDPNGDFHILMIDYDDRFKLEDLKCELYALNHKFNLTSAYIFESSYRHYFVFWFWESLPYMKCLEIIRESKCDPNYKTYRMIRDEMTLRLTNKKGYKIKPTMVAIVEGLPWEHRVENKKIYNLVKEMTIWPK